jgi:protein required for attachment to host cells
MTVRLPDAMPEITKKTLLVVCDTHHCMFIDAGGHALTEKETVESKETQTSEHPGTKQSPAAMGKGGMISGVDDPNQQESNRLKNFANEVSRHIDASVSSQGIEELYISAPGKFLSVLKTHLSTKAAGLVAQALDGNFMKEPPAAILVRFRPDLKDAIKELRDGENFSAKKHLPK